MKLRPSAPSGQRISSGSKQPVRKGKGVNDSLDIKKQKCFIDGLSKGQYVNRSGAVPSTEELSKIFQDKQFNCVIYAPPNSGKSGFIDLFDHDGVMYDTDYLPYWKVLNPRIVLTNDPKMLRCGRTSIALLPSRPVFENRCKERGLNYERNWYTDALESCSSVTQLIKSDELLHLHAKDLLLAPDIREACNLDIYDPSGN